MQYFLTYMYMCMTTIFETIVIGSQVISYELQDQANSYQLHYPIDTKWALNLVSIKYMYVEAKNTLAGKATH